MICLFSLGQLHLASHYLREKKKEEKGIPSLSGSLPKVTIQLPIYNEQYVIERLINRIVKMDYPGNLLQIQVLDDSTDNTSELIKQLVLKYQSEGVNISQIRRADRNGFKAGALQNGLEHATGEYIAIFDSDFLPPLDFLQKSIPYFADEAIGMVQSRWGHINNKYSILTQVQAFGLNAHFSVEQMGRKAAGSFINFNGTGGIWRKQCIIDSGGWSADTLTEDLDLSYRAQLKGWKFEFVESLISPAELPILVSAIKTQQFRWNKGAAETGRKLLKEVLTSGKKPINKLHAIMHLFNSSVFVFLFLAGLLSIPVLILKQSNPYYDPIFDFGLVLLIGFTSIAIFYWVAHKNIPTGSNFLFIFSSFLILITGFSYHNTKAVLQGLVGFKSAFKRTPKFNIINRHDSWLNNIYIHSNLRSISWIEGLISLYFASGLVLGVLYSDYDLLIFHSVLATGFASVFILSLKQIRL